MKFRILLLVAVAASLQSFGQQWVQDSIYMGAGYTNDVYYSFKNDSIKGESNQNWHIAFDMIPYTAGGAVGVIANHAQADMKVYSLPLKASTKFASLSASDTMSKNGPLYNADSAWNFGAFNANVGGSPFDFGWGKYNMNTHMVDGDSLYLVYVGSDVYKFTVSHYHSLPNDTIHYIFRIAKFDGSNDYTDTLYRKAGGFDDNNFGYYNINTNQFLDREPAKTTWDICFTKYITWVLMGPPPAVPYPVTGILSNIGMEVAEVSGVNPDTTMYSNYAYTAHSNKIGSDWKTFNMSVTPPVYDIDTLRTYFIKSDNSLEYYQLKFTAFDLNTGKVAFAKRKVADVTSIKSVAQNNVLTHALVPNPANYNADLMLDMKVATGGAMLLVTDMNGRVAQRTNIDLKKGLNGLRINTSGFATGTYMVTVTDGSWKTTDKLIVQH